MSVQLAHPFEKIKAEYVDHMGDDLRVVNAARVSFDKESDYLTDDRGDYLYSEVTQRGYEGLQVSEKDKKLITYLAKHKHWTPFSHPMITLRETVPIFVARQRFKHMVGFTYNEVSRRYVDAPPTFYLPDTWRSRPDGSVKQGSGGQHENSGYYRREYKEKMELLASIYADMIENGVAPEQARMILPQSMMTSYYVTGSLYAFANAYRQRIDPHAQAEIQDLACMWDEVIRPIFPVSWRALVDES